MPETHAHYLRPHARSIKVAAVRRRSWSRIGGGAAGAACTLVATPGWPGDLVFSGPTPIDASDAGPRLGLWASIELSLGTGTGCVRVLLIESHAGLRTALSRWLIAVSEVQAIAAAATQRQGVDLALILRPDVVISDARLSEGSGIEACAELRRQLPRQRVLILTSLFDRSERALALAAGAEAYLLKELDMQRLIDSISG